MTEAAEAAKAKVLAIHPKARCIKFTRNNVHILVGVCTLGTGKDDDSAWINASIGLPEPHRAQNVWSKDCGPEPICTCGQPVTKCTRLHDDHYPPKLQAEPHRAEQSSTPEVQTPPADYASLPPLPLNGDQDILAHVRRDNEGADETLLMSWFVRRRRERQLLKAMADLAATRASLDSKVSDYEEVLADHRRLVRMLDVELNGEDGAAKQASLCDLIGSFKGIRGEIVALQESLDRARELLAECKSKFHFFYEEKIRNEIKQFLAETEPK